MHHYMHIRIRYFILSIAAALLAGGLLGAALLYQVTPAVAAHPGVGNHLAKVSRVYRLLETEYFQEIDRDKLIEGAIDGMVRALGDPYTSYMAPVEADKFYEGIAGSFEGIGAEIREEDGVIVVVSPIHGSPAEQAGVRPNDRILGVNGVSLVGMKVDEAVHHIRGPKGTEAKLRIQRPGQDAPFELTLIRDTIPLETVRAEMLDERTGRIHITKFSETTPKELDAAVKRLMAEGAEGVILDVRQNPGGLLSAAVEMAGAFVERGKPVLQVKSGDGRVQQYPSAGKRYDLPVVMLIDGGSASASEILAGALKESAGVLLVGEKTFGKGSVQTARELGDGSTLKFTQAQWLTPLGNYVHNTGISPDVAVPLPDYANLPYLFVEREFAQGSSAVQVRTAQAMLKALGHEPGRDDGLLDAATAAALRDFQGAAGIAQTGTLNSATAARMNTAMQRLIKENDVQLSRAQELLLELLQK